MPSQFLKDPTAVQPYQWDWAANYLATGETITSYTITEPSGINVDSHSKTGGVVTAIVSGGTAGVKYPIVCHITTSAGRQEDATITIICYDK